MHAIEVHGVSKSFRIPHERHTTLAERLLSFGRSGHVEILDALCDLSFDVPAGEFVGVIGANGSGKSTLLKIIAGVFVPDRGTVHVSGSLASLLELGLGFHQELTVRENVRLYATLLRYPRREMEDRINDAIRFAGLVRFQDAKLKSLSSGMVVRLAFATALRAEADIMLLDEVMAVGDAQFQRKCLEVFTELKRQRRTIVLVSHDLAAVQRFCDRVFWLDRGRLVLAGDPTEVVQSYLGTASAASLEPLSEQQQVRDHRWGNGSLRFVTARLETEDGTAVTRVASGTPVVLRMEAEVSRACPEPVFGFIVWTAGQMAYSTNTTLLGIRLAQLDPGDRCAIQIRFVTALQNGQYSITVAAADADGTAYDWINHAVAFVVERSHGSDGIADLGASFECDVRSADRPAARYAAPMR
jgi:lipopolysaccharide transport system ATP-binding protein